jgi:hypothetical protein
MIWHGTGEQAVHKRSTSKNMPIWKYIRTGQDVNKWWEIAREGGRSAAEE